MSSSRRGEQGAATLPKLYRTKQPRFGFSLILMATRRRTSLFRDPVFLLALVAGLLAFVVQSGEAGTADTQHRINSAHAFWTSDPPVFDWEYPEFGVHGRDGLLQSWYGIGQSLLMLPQDIIGTGIENLGLFAGYKNTDPTVRNIFISY